MGKDKRDEEMDPDVQPAELEPQKLLRGAALLLSAICLRTARKLQSF
jgi:hypothetical protein